MVSGGVDGHDGFSITPCKKHNTSIIIALYISKISKIIIGHGENRKNYSGFSGFYLPQKIWSFDDKLFKLELSSIYTSFSLEFVVTLSILYSYWYSIKKINSFTKNLFSRNIVESIKWKWKAG